MSSNRKAKEEMLTIILEHSRIMYQVISDMGVYYSTWAEGSESNKKDLEKKKNKMQLSEEEADELKIQLIKNFSEAEAFNMGAYVNLVLRMDNIINYPLEFVDMLTNIKIEGNTVSFQARGITYTLIDGGPGYGTDRVIVDDGKSQREIKLYGGNISIRTKQ